MSTNPEAKSRIISLPNHKLIISYQLWWFQNILTVAFLPSLLFKVDFEQANDSTQMKQKGCKTYFISLQLRFIEKLLLIIFLRWQQHHNIKENPKCTNFYVPSLLLNLREERWKSLRSIFDINYSRWWDIFDIYSNTSKSAKTTLKIYSISNIWGVGIFLIYFILQCI